MSQQDKQPSQQQGVAQPVHAAASLPYQIAYISVPQAGADGTGQSLRAVPFHIVPVLGQMPGLQMHHVAQLLQGQQLQQAAVYHDAARQGAVLAQGAGTGPAVLANLDPAMRAALASPGAVGAAVKSPTVAGSQQTKSGGTAAGAPSASDAAGGAAAAAPAAAGEAASSAAAERGNTAAPAAGTQAVANSVEAAASDGKEPAVASPARAQKGQKQKMQQQRTADAAGLPLVTASSASLPDEDVPTSPAAAAMAAAAAAAASQIPAAAQAAIAAAEAAAAAAAAAGAAGPLSGPTLAAAGGRPAPAAAVESPAAQKLQPTSNEQYDMMLLDSDADGAPANSGGPAGATAAAAKKGPSERECRLKQRHAFTLKRKFADLTAQIEGALCEARALSSWKHSPRPAKLPRLDEPERKMLAASRARRLAEAAAKNCLGVIKAVMAHKFAFPFNSPVDLTKYVDYCSYVKTPMDFGTMKVKTEEGRYAEPAEVYNDALLVFANAKVYNQPTEDVFYMATVLQEFFQERWQKLVVPKLQEDAKLSRGEEDQLRGRKASAARHAAEAAAKETACRLVAHLDELHEQLGQLRVQAALLCEPLPGSDRSSLAAALDVLPLKQLEAALGLVLPRLAAGLWEGQQQQQQQRGQEGKLEVEVDLTRCSALELRQLQHFVAACHTHNISKQQQQQQQLAAEAAALQAAIAVQPAAAVQAADMNKDMQQAGASGDVAAQPAAAAAAVAAADPGSAAAAPDAAAVATVGNADAVQAAAGTAAAAASAVPVQAVPSTAAAAAVGAHSMSGFPVVCVHTSASLSERAGIIWPGQVIGAGLKARSRLLLPGHADQPPSAAAAGGVGNSTLGRGGPFAAALGKRRSSETGAALNRPPLPPSARPSRLATNSAALQSAAAAAVHSPTLPSPFAGPAATMVPPGSLDCTPAVTHTSGRRQQLVGASSSTDLQQQGQQQHQQQQQQSQDQQRQQQRGLQLGDEGQGASEGDPAAASGASLGTGRSSGNSGSLGTRQHAKSSSSSSSGSDTDSDGPSDQQQQRAQSNQQQGGKPSAGSPSSDSRAASVPDENDPAAAAAATAAATAASDSGAAADNVESADEEFVDAAEAAADSDDQGQDDAGNDMQE